MDYYKALTIAVEAALAAGEAVMEIYKTDFNVELKKDNSPLTLADKKANDIINAFLKPTSIPIISEENKTIDYSVRKTWTSCWIVDPIDGTKEFIKRNGEFTVNIAYVEHGQPILGIIYVPASKMLYFGNVLDKKAFKSQLKNHKTSFNEILDLAQALEPKSPSQNIAVVGSRSHMNSETLDFVNQLKKEDKEVVILSKGSSLKFCLVAEGKADIYPRFAPTMEWDTAAGHAICNAVGIKVISNTTNQPLRYNKEDLYNPWFIVS